MTTAAPVQGGGCERCRTPLEAGDLRCSVCALSAPQRSDAPRMANAEILRCTGCGAAVSYQVEAQAPRCRFCSEVMEVETPVDPIEIAQAYVPFSIDRKEAQAALARWQSSLGWFRPADLQERSSVERIEPVYWASWLFDAHAMVTWAADSDAGRGRSRWAPHSGRCELSWNDVLVSASRGLTTTETLALGSFGMELRELGPGEEPKKPKGATVESFDVQRSAARRRILECLHALTERTLCARHIPGSSFRNVHASLVLSRLSTRRVLLPTWVFVYRYDGKPYRALVHGQNARTLGDAPYSWAKIALVVVAALVAVGLAILIAQNV